MASFPHKLSHKLIQAKEKFLFRSLKTNYASVDFSSNDYLGFSTQGYLHQEIPSLEPSIKMGSTGSRLISGNSVLFNEIEKDIANFHEAETALIYQFGL
jgi:8-amino-7-oxononanoate synthase